MKKLNLNNIIRVKLTDLGKDIYYHQFDDLNEWITNRGRKPLERIYPKVDDEGYSEFQLWHFMKLYGPYMEMAAPNVVEPLNIYINDNDLEGA